MPMGLPGVCGECVIIFAPFTSFPYGSRCVKSLPAHSLIVGWVGCSLVCVSVRQNVCCFDVVETSYEGHMVDALASRADEGRWSLR